MGQEKGHTSCHLPSRRSPSNKARHIEKTSQGVRPMPSGDGIDSETSAVNAVRDHRQGKLDQVAKSS